MYFLPVSCRLKPDYDGLSCYVYFTTVSVCVCVCLSVGSHVCVPAGT